MRAPTARQLMVLDAIEDLTVALGCPPTLRELREHFGWKSHNAAADHLRALSRKKLIVWSPAKARTIRVLPSRYRRGVPVTILPETRCLCGAASFGVDVCPGCGCSLRRAA